MKLFCNLNKKTIIINDKQQKIINEMIAYHGSKANFDEFNIAYIGSGIGAQEFGEGLYLTFNKEAAYSYGGNVYTVDIPNENEGNYIYYDRPISNELFTSIINGIIEDMKLQYPNEYQDEQSIIDLQKELYDIMDPSEGRHLMYNIHRYIDDTIVVPKILKRAGVTGFIYNNGKVDNVIMFSSKDIKILDKEVIEENTKEKYFSPSELNNKTIIITEKQSHHINDLLFEQYLIEATLNDIYTKYYSNIPQDEFWQIIKADPTYNEEKSQKMGKYGKWLLNLYKQGKLKNEDLYKATDYLSYFVKYYNRIVDKDINKLSDLSSLYNVIKPYKDAAENGEEMTTSKSDEMRKIKQDAEKFYEDDTWLVVIPHSREASCYYGKNTQWCTAATGSYNYFDNYYSQGLLYININKTTNKKYQFHFETNSFMDETDIPINSPIAKTIGLSDGLVQAYANKYGGEAIIALTCSIDWDEDEPINGEEPFYSYIDYDGYAFIVRIDGVNVIKCKNVSDYQLTSENDIQYLGCGLFKFNDYQTEETYDEESDEYYDTGETIITDAVTIYNAKTQQRLELSEEARSIFLLNKSYLKYNENGYNYVVSSNDLKVYLKTKASTQIMDTKYFIENFRLINKDIKFNRYEDDIIILCEYVQKMGSIYKVYDLYNQNYIEPPFENYRLIVKDDEDGYRYITFDDYYRYYCYLLSDGSLSQVYEYQ